MQNSNTTGRGDKTVNGTEIGFVPIEECGELVAAIGRTTNVILGDKTQSLDDAEPITDEWFQSEFNHNHVVLSAPSPGQLQRDFCQTLRCENGEVFLVKAVSFGPVRFDLPQIKTRGQLRKLISALKGE